MPVEKNPQERQCSFVTEDKNHVVNDISNIALPDEREMISISAIVDEIDKDILG